MNLLAGGRRGGGGDTADMVRARDELLRLGHLDVISDALAGAVVAGPRAHVIADAGAGTGHHLSRVLATAPDAHGLALDVSAHAARRAAGAHARIGAVVCDVWRGLPLGDGVVDVLLNVFAPRNGAEFHRVLAPGGRLVVVTPTPRHLEELIAPLGLLTVDGRKPERLAATLGDRFAEDAARTIETTITVDRAHVLLLADMGPSAWHATLAARAERAERVARLPDRVAVTVSCRVAIHRPLRPAPRPAAAPPCGG